MIRVGRKHNILILWVFWQVFDVPRSILKAWKNILLFNLNYFSVPLLLRTFFSHWRRYRWYYDTKGLYIGKYLEVLFSNFISRILGAIVRTFLIIIGLLVEIFIFFSGIVVFLGWVVLPLILILGIYYGARQILL